MCSGHAMLLIRSSFASLLVMMSLGVHAAIGLCPTPTGPIGIIPCDTACTGSSFINGAMSLNTNYLMYVQTLAKASSTVTQCTVSTSNIEAKTKSKLKTASSMLKTLLRLLSVKEINQADGLILKFGSSVTSATTTMKAIFLELIKEIISKTDSFIGLLSLEYKNEVPSSLAPAISSLYIKGISSVNIRMKSISEERLRINLQHEAYTRIQNTTGMASMGAEKRKKLSLDKATFIINTTAEYFNRPAFLPENSILYSHADLKLAMVLAKNESNCLIYQSMVDFSHFSCSPFTPTTSPDELLSELSRAQESQNGIVANSFRSVADEVFTQKDDLISGQCLEGIMGLNFEANFVSIENLQHLNLLKAFKDYLIKTGCSAAVSYMNEKIKTLNKKINDEGSKMNKMSHGLIGASSETNKDGIFSSEGKITPIMESELGDKFSEKINNEFNKFLFDEEDPLNGKNEIDFTNQSYLKDGTINRSVIKNKKFDSESISNEIDETVCQVFGC